MAPSEKSNEITAIPELLAALAQKGCIVTIDAMGWQKSIAADIIKAEAETVLALKDNHPTLHHEVQGFFEDGILTDFDGIPHDFHEESYQAQDRDEVRKVWTSSDLDCLPEAEEWAGMNSLFCVEAHRTALGKESSVHRRYFLSSIPDLAGQEAARIVRAHRQIENGLHWVLDIAFWEDDARARKGHAAENLATVRSIALNLLKQETSAKRGIKTKRLRPGWDHRYLLKILGDWMRSPGTATAVATRPGFREGALCQRSPSALAARIDGSVVGGTGAGKARTLSLSWCWDRLRLTTLWGSVPPQRRPQLLPEPGSAGRTLVQGEEHHEGRCSRGRNALPAGGLWGQGRARLHRRE